MGKPSLPALIAAPFTGGTSLLVEPALKAGENLLKMPKPPAMADPANNPLPKPPTVDDADTKARMAAAEQQDRQRKKRTSTILTSAQGVLDQAPVQIKSLLGQ